MNGLPYYKRYPRDFIEGTVRLPYELKTAYAFLLDLIYLQGGKLPDEPRYISGLFGCSVRKWKSLREGLLAAGKIAASDGFLTNYRAVSELESYAKLQRKQAENRARPNKNNDLQTPNHHPSDTDTDTDKKEEEKRRAREARLALEREFSGTFWPAYPNKVGKPKAFTAFVGARRRSALDQIMLGLRRYVDAKPPDRPWLNPATFLNQERFNDQPAGNGLPPPTELPKWQGPDSDNARNPQRPNGSVLQERGGVHSGQEGGGNGSNDDDYSGNGGMELLGGLLH